MNLKRTGRYFFLRIIRLRGKPYFVAGGIFWGIFIGLTPIVPLHTIIIIALTLATRTSTAAGIIFSWLACNPLTFFPIYYLSVYFGNKVTPYHLDSAKIYSIMKMFEQADGFIASIYILLDQGYQTITLLVAGGAVFALPLGLMGYFISLKIFSITQQKRTSDRG
ncbi:DUF2062 domain-containing protein [Desulfotalea psychrophila]|uniref:DUF2062 domain-containing protein n=1 Tax=Desulfotalea psychrophila (strain LSv54 / DSM 12343) TaxID=177439 RepID=Q6AL72_DESPS|nr:DUF2062 domain-containing protein [Desulfotalea psychrophila]CAG36903.1 unknown protein [Desulfotalea psychrophila LSv54]